MVNILTIQCRAKSVKFYLTNANFGAIIIYNKTGELVWRAERKRNQASTHNLIRIMPT